MKISKVYGEYVFLMTLFVGNMPLISADACSYKDTDAPQSVASTIAWYRRPIVKDVFVGATIVSLTAVIVAQKIKIDDLARVVRHACEAHAENRKTLNDTQESISELKKTLAIIQQAMPVLKNTEAQESRGLGVYFFIGSIIFAIYGNYGR